MILYVILWISFILSRWRIGLAYLMRAIMGHGNEKLFKLNWKEETIDIYNIFSLICISLYVMYLCYVSFPGLEYRTGTTATLYLD
jgi:hypothetical protein